MNAKETLKKLAEVLGVTSEEAEAPVEEQVETVEESAEVKAEETVEETAEPTEEVKEEVEEAKAEEPAQEPEAVEEVQEEVKEEAKEEVDPRDARVAEMEKQINSLKELLANVLENDGKDDVPEVPKQEPKGLTHSPEKQVKPRANGIQNKGESIQSRVWKYINNS